MAKENVAVFSEPTGHGLEYCSCFFKKVRESSHPGIEVIGTDGSVSGNDGAIAEYDPAIWYSVGHGAACLHTVGGLAHYLIKLSGSHPSCTSNLRLDTFADKVVHLLSCITGAELGPALIDHGVGAYVGYSDLFYYGVRKTTEGPPSPCDPPDDFRDFFTFGDSDVEGERALVLGGKSVGDAVAAMIAKFDEYFEKYTTGEWKDRWIAPHAANLLMHDKGCLTALGDMSLVPCPGAIALPVPLEWLAGGAIAGMSVGGIIGYSEEIGRAFYL